jgi:very-short-patch-repair endonuclease
VKHRDPTFDICRSQAGVISRRQALDAGLTERQIDRRVSSHRWDRIAPGVYLAAEAAMTWHAWAYCMLLAAGPGAVLIGETSAQLRCLVPKQLPICVAIPTHRRCEVSAPNLRLLRMDIPADEQVTVDGLPTTNRLRTASDVAHLMPLVQAQPIVDLMLVRDMVVLEELTAVVADSRRHGSAQARRLMASANDRAAAESERIARRLLQAAGLSGWVANHEVTIKGRKLKIDLALRRLKIAIEVKGWMFHSAGDRGASDDARVTDLQLAGWLVIPVSWLALHQNPDAFIAQVREAVAQRSALLAP